MEQTAGFYIVGQEDSGGSSFTHTSMIWALDLMRARGQQRSVRALRTQAHQKDMIHTPR